MAQYSKKISLPIIITKDLLSNKISFLLLICLLISAFLVIVTTYKTRLLNNKLENFYSEYNNIDNETSKLILEENILFNKYFIKK